jgi:hypothetical protein
LNGRAPPQMKDKAITRIAGKKQIGHPFVA